MALFFWHKTNENYQNHPKLVNPSLCSPHMICTLQVLGQKHFGQLIKRQHKHWLQHKKEKKKKRWKCERVVVSWSVVHVSFALLSDFLFLTDLQSVFINQNFSGICLFSSILQLFYATFGKPEDIIYKFSCRETISNFRYFSIGVIQSIKVRPTSL